MATGLGARTANNLPGEPLVPDFDSGINSSAAWTEHVATRSEQVGHVQEASVSDEELGVTPAPTEELLNAETHDQTEQETFLARTLYDFDGKPEFGELAIRAGVEVLVLKPDVGDGWSLVDCAGQVGLIPSSYYAVWKSKPFLFFYVNDRILCLADHIQIWICCSDCQSTR
jgi:sorting nexin-9/18/33